MANPDVCRDRYGSFQPDVFKLFSCSMCYTYLFPREGHLTPNNTSPTHLVPRDLDGPYPEGTSVIADVENSNAVHKVCKTLTSDDCSRWTRCCHAAVRCCNRQLNEPLRNTTELFCPRTWDGFGCFGDTDASQRVHINCPLYIEHASPWELAYKECTVNGTWYRNQLTDSEWTDYTECVVKENFSTILYISIACSLFSILLLIPACIIFLKVRQLRAQKRVRLHISLFISFLMACVVSILWDFIVYKDRLENEKELTIMHENSGGCKFLYILIRYFGSTIFFWMFCEGFFLHRLIVHAFKVPKKLRWYYLCGWVLPALPVGAYAVIRVSFEEYNTECWVPHAGSYEWIIYVPNLVCILANLFFLVNILRILLTQMQSHPNEPSNYRKALKATFVLVPLFGLQQFLVIYRPDDKSALFIYEAIASIVQNTRGAVVALIFCFFNGEVHTHLKSILKRKWRKPSLRSDLSRKGSNMSTQCTTIGRRIVISSDPTSPFLPLSPSGNTFEELCTTPLANGHLKKSNSNSMAYGDANL